MQENWNALRPEDYYPNPSHLRTKIWRICLSRGKHFGGSEVNLVHLMPVYVGVLHEGLRLRDLLLVTQGCNNLRHSRFQRPLIEHREAESRGEGICQRQVLEEMQPF